MISDEQMEELRKLKELLDADILSQEEFDTKKALILGDATTKAVEADSNPVEEKKVDDSVNTEISAEETKNLKPELVKQEQVDSIDISDQPDKSDEKDVNTSTTPVGLPNYENNAIPEQKKSNKKIIIIAVVAVLVILGLLLAIGGSGDNKAESGETSSDTSEYSEEEEPEEEEAVLDYISAEYSGDTEKGTVLDEYNSGITVTGSYDDGTTETISGWTVEEPQTLKSGKTSTITISYEDQTCELEVTCTSISKKQFQKSCKEISYNSLARNPGKYENKNIKIYGQIIQVVEGDGNTVNFRIGTKNSGYGSWYDDVFLVEYTYSDGESRYLEDDMVTMWGTYGGTYTYESTGGADITVPLLYAKYIKME